jgi:hypothetical protein
MTLSATQITAFMGDDPSLFEYFLGLITTFSAYIEKSWIIYKPSSCDVISKNSSEGEIVF